MSSSSHLLNQKIDIINYSFKYINIKGEESITTDKLIVYPDDTIKEVYIKLANHTKKNNT